MVLGWETVPQFMTGNSKQPVRLSLKCDCAAHHKCGSRVEVKTIYVNNKMAVVSQVRRCQAVHAFAQEASVAHGVLAKCGAVAEHQKQAALPHLAPTANAAVGCRKCFTAQNYSSPGASE